MDLEQDNPRGFEARSQSSLIHLLGSTLGRLLLQGWRLVSAGR